MEITTPCMPGIPWYNCCSNAVPIWCPWSQYKLSDSCCCSPTNEYTSQTDQPALYSVAFKNSCRCCALILLRLFFLFSQHTTKSARHFCRNHNKPLPLLPTFGGRASTEPNQLTTPYPLTLFTVSTSHHCYIANNFPELQFTPTSLLQTPSHRTHTLICIFLQQRNMQICVGVCVSVTPLHTHCLLSIAQRLLRLRGCSCKCEGRGQNLK